MATSTTRFPPDANQLFLTDGGLETTLVFLEGFALPCFAAFDLLKEEQGVQAIKNYYRRYLHIAADYQTGFILESPTWRANPDWLQRTGYPPEALADINRKAIQLMAEVKAEYEGRLDNILISGCIGPRGDGYRPENSMTADAAEAYHAAQVAVLRQTPADLVSAITMNYAEEAVGIARAAAAAGLPAVISFTVETDGRLPTGMHLKDAIGAVDAGAPVQPLYYMINCAHPTHFTNVLQEGRQERWTQRIRGLRANASCKSHAELDEATTLDRGDPEELGAAHKRLKRLLPHLNVFGGCCGTDEAHVLAIIRQLQPA